MNKALALLLAALPLSSAFAGGGVPIFIEDVPDQGTLDVWGQLQVWGTLIDQDDSPVADPASYGDPELDPGFSIPRGRIGMNGFLPGAPAGVQASWNISIGVATAYDVLTPSNSNVQLVDGYGELTIDGPIGPLAVVVGQHKVTFGREQLMASADLLFQERGIASEWISPARGVGASVGQTIPLGDAENAPEIAIRGGAWNGNGSFLGDDDPGILSAARVEFNLGETYQTWSHDLDSAAGVGISLSSDDALATTTSATGADVLARVKWVTLMAELSQSTLSPADSTLGIPAVTNPTKRFGLVGQLSFYVPVAGIGGLGIGGQFSAFDDSTALDDNGDVSVIHGGLTWRNMMQGLDLGAGYILRTETNGRSIDNDSIRAWVQMRPKISLR
ncbi:MAG: hypothetical protein GWP91_18560 [Rhodobacterales bacterium]|nr:hypothetical protein [Rhodobacterales bacterium]